MLEAAGVFPSCRTRVHALWLLCSCVLCPTGGCTLLLSALHGQRRVTFAGNSSGSCHSVTGSAG